VATHHHHHPASYSADRKQWPKSGGGAPIQRQARLAAPDTPTSRCLQQNPDEVYENW
jgi:hypothetical protein